MEKRAICMPVGPAGVRPATLQLIVSLIRDSTFHALMIAESHVIPARNSVWSAACRANVDKVLWIDSDIYARPDELDDFIERADQAFVDNQKLSWRGAICKRRGGGLALTRLNDQILMGLGLAYWHVDRMKAAFFAQGLDPTTPFRWIPPWSEDYAASRDVWASGQVCDYDATLSTSHDGVGDWSARDPEDDSLPCAACAGNPLPDGCKWCDSSGRSGKGLT